MSISFAGIPLPTFIEGLPFSVGLVQVDTVEVGHYAGVDVVPAEDVVSELWVNVLVVVDGGGMVAATADVLA